MYKYIYTYVYICMYTYIYTYKSAVDAIKSAESRVVEPFPIPCLAKFHKSHVCRWYRAIPVAS